MKQTLQLKLGQQLTMTPQLQQAIRLLQLSSLELQSEIQEILESNPMLDTEESGDNQNDDSSQNDENIVAKDTSDKDVDHTVDMDIPNDLPVDSDWGDTFDTYTPIKSLDPDDNRIMEQPQNSGESLNEHLMWQMRLTPFSEVDMAIATSIIDSIDESGFLTAAVEELHQSLVEQGLDIELDEVESVLRRVQNFDPPGVGARNLQESMVLQLGYYDMETPWLTEAKAIIKDHFDLLANRDYLSLMRRTKLSEKQLQNTLVLIQSLNPRPGSQITDTQPEYVVPDVFVRKIKGQWKVELNPEVTPKLSINALYANLAQKNSNSSDTTYMKNHLQEARWFLKSLKSRNDTLLKVARCIVERQKDFFEHGDEGMKPLVMHDVAEVVSMHESTISRVTTKKYMHTPRGIYELKYFFSSHVSTASGGECSATAIRAMLKKLIAAEQANKPLSDNKLAILLGKQGINVARRTVAKYREAMSIPPSNERKRLI
ncbi:MAG: RNA polymerase factor sigma-54 [Gammaproteobacteria bacterium]|nr:RNA polymerase factor sigma-54 [Gammaproteobacteria bacterium]MDH5801545.1 RNA polymerase factor sigma-54 [Gammaproteobacteria bacterium]